MCHYPTHQKPETLKVVAIKLNKERIFDNNIVDFLCPHTKKAYQTKTVIEAHRGLTVSLHP